jgi:hypothetical protein
VKDKFSAKIKSLLPPNLIVPEKDGLPEELLLASKLQT